MAVITIVMSERCLRQDQVEQLRSGFPQIEIILPNNDAEYAKVMPSTEVVVGRFPQELLPQARVICAGFRTRAPVSIGS